MSNIEFSSVLVETMEEEELLTGLGLYGREALKQRELVQLGKKLCVIIHASAEKCNLPTELRGPAPFDRSPSLNDLKYVEKHTDEGQTRALYCSRLHIEALQARGYLGKFIDYSVKETSKYSDCLVKLPKELYNELEAINADYVSGAEISSIDDQLMKLTEKVALACGNETATAFEGIGYRVILVIKAIQTHQSLEKFIHSIFLRSREEIPEDSHYSWMNIPKVVESNVISDDLHVPIYFAEKESYDIYNMRWHEASHGLKDALKNVRKSDHMAIISSSFLAMSAQAGGSFLSSAFSDHPSNRTGKWALDFVEAAMLAGFGLTVGGMGIRRVKPEISGFLIKSGAIATAWAFIASLAIPLSPVVAWTVGPIAAGFVAVSIGLA